jgi:hypothetical protein
MAVVTAGTMMVSSLAVFGPSEVTEAAFAAGNSAPASLTASAATAGALSARGGAAVGALAGQRPTVAITPTAIRPPGRVGASAPYAFATKAFNQWWARRLMVRHGWKNGFEFRALVKLWDRESHWNYRSHNNSSGAHGIPQALPGTKMRTAGADWRTNPVTQIKWGLNYIDTRYGSPSRAWTHFLRHGWY